MPIDKPTTGEPFDRDTFERELAELIDHAREVDVDIEGAYNVRTPQFEGTDYTVEISKIAKRSGFDLSHESSPID